MNLWREREALAAWLIPLVVMGSVLWIGLLAFGNVRERRTEIGLWRALGFGTRHILCVFLGKAVILGFTGALLGSIAGYVVGVLWGVWDGIPLLSETWATRLDPVLWGLLLFAAPILACLATWIPAMLAAQQDPALVLREE